ncbi:Protein of unknown function [Cotesia congregata]|uniref:Uncharacterized protein n=1 Tax=Cotesia congregata TaxID=51543 RepID=A0A8J2HME6_COTCN|nr:Protein of unknown function [Cotesia congregata]
MSATLIPLMSRVYIEKIQMKIMVPRPYKFNELIKNSNTTFTSTNQQNGDVCWLGVGDKPRSSGSDVSTEVPPIVSNGFFHSAFILITGVISLLHSGELFILMLSRRNFEKTRPLNSSSSLKNNGISSLWNWRWLDSLALTFRCFITSFTISTAAIATSDFITQSIIFGSEHCIVKITFKIICSS